MAKTIYVLRGGIWGWDGMLTSGGMDLLAQRLNKIAPTYIFNWDQSEQVDARLATHSGKRTVVAYSGGGWKASTLESRIDLMVLYDPSPTWRMQPIGTNVKRCICYHNNAPAFFGYGGAKAKAVNARITQITIHEIKEWHPAVQNDERLHKLTIAAVTEL